MFEHSRNLVNAKLSAIATITGNIEQIESKRREAESLKGKLADLETQRAQELGIATVEGRAPKTAAIDKDIKAVGDQLDKMADTVTGAEHGIQILRGRLADAERELGELRQTASEEAFAELQSQHQAVIQEYRETVAKFGEIMPKMLGIVRAAQSTRGGSISIMEHVTGTLLGGLHFVEPSNEPLGIFQPPRWRVPDNLSSLADTIADDLRGKYRIP